MFQEENIDSEKYQQILQTWFYLLLFLKKNPRAREIYSKNGLTDSCIESYTNNVNVIYRVW